jgi:hypothetical protein
MLVYHTRLGLEDLRVWPCQCEVSRTLKGLPITLRTAGLSTKCQARAGLRAVGESPLFIYGMFPLRFVADHKGGHTMLRRMRVPVL